MNIDIENGQIISGLIYIPKHCKSHDFISYHLQHCNNTFQKQIKSDINNSILYKGVLNICKRN